MKYLDYVLVDVGSLNGQSLVSGVDPPYGRFFLRNREQIDEDLFNWQKKKLAAARDGASGSELFKEPEKKASSFLQFVPPRWWYDVLVLLVISGTAQVGEKSAELWQWACFLQRSTYSEGTVWQNETQRPGFVDPDLLEFVEFVWYV